MKDKKQNIIKSTKEGRLYIKTSDFFKQVKIQQTVNDLLKSDIVKGIEARKKLKSQLH
jgi:hypothetical protein